jgi:hypothetical protein
MWHMLLPAVPLLRAAVLPELLVECGRLQLGPRWPSFDVLGHACSIAARLIFFIGPVYAVYKSL